MKDENIKLTALNEQYVDRRAMSKRDYR